MATKTLNYSLEFKQKIVALCRSSQTQNKLAREYGLARTTIRRWVGQIQPEQPGFESVAQPLNERAKAATVAREPAVARAAQAAEKGNRLVCPR